MTATRTIRLTCDRCGTEVTHDDADGHRPADWRRITFGTMTGDLCKPCADHVTQSLRPADAPPPPPPVQVRLGLTIEDRRVAIDLAEVAICAAIKGSVAVFIQSPTRLLEPDARAAVLNEQRVHAVALVDRILAKVKELPHG